MSSEPNLLVAIHLSDYAQGLLDAVKERYVEKLRKIGATSCPFAKISGWSQGNELLSIIPKIEFADIFIYMIETKSSYTWESFENYKGLDAYKWATAGWVRCIMGIHATST